MQIKIFVVKTEKPNVQVLEHLRKTLVEMFKGLSIIPSVRGYWVNDKGKEEKDKVEIWEIYTDTKGFNNEEFTDIIGQIKAVTKQQAQAYSLDNEIYMGICKQEPEVIMKVLLGRSKTLFDGLKARWKAYQEQLKKNREIAKQRYKEQFTENSKDGTKEEEDETEGDSEINECEEESEIPEDFLE